MSSSLVLFEDYGWINLSPLTLWRSVFELRVGRKIVLDRTAQRAGLPVTGVWTRDWLAPVAAQRCGAPVNRAVASGTRLVNGRWLFDQPVKFPKPPAVGVVESEIAYVICDDQLAEHLTPGDMQCADRLKSALQGVPRHDAPGRMIRYPWDIIANLGELLESDWQAGDAAIETKLDDRLVLEHRERLHIGENTRIHPTAIINPGDGAIYISHDVQIGAYAVIDGPAYVGPGSRLRPHTWVHGGNAIGPVCRVGGELDGCVLHSYTNKQHTGFLGHAYVGCWVNIGAGATNSDLKNTYGKIRVPVNGVNVDTGLQFFGAVIGDYAKIGINATIPTGAVIGLAASIASTRPLPKYVPSFGWVSDGGLKPGDHLRLLDASVAAMARRNMDMSDEEIELFLGLAERVREYEKPIR